MEKTRKQQVPKQYSRDELARIRYQCRRGMLELDVFLMPYFEQCFIGLTRTKQGLFIEMLTEADPDLFNWLMGNSEAKKPYQETVKDIHSFQLSGVGQQGV